MTDLLLASPSQQVTLTVNAPAMLSLAYTLIDPATTELVLCDLIGWVVSTLQPATSQQAGTYEYSYDTSQLELPSDTYVLTFYCNGIRIKTRQLSLINNG